MQTTTEREPRTIELFTLITTILASSMAFIDGSALSIVQLTLQRDFNADYSLIAWVINGYNLMLAAFVLIGGALGDRYGRKRIFTLGIIIFAAASLTCALAPSIELLIVARIVQGLGGSLMIPGSLALISAVFEGERRGAAIGTWSALGAAMVIFGPLLGGLFAEANNWRGVFYINLPIAALALLALTRVPESRDETQHGRLDIPGAVLVALGLAGMTYGLTEAPALGWGSPLVLFTLLGGLTALVLFVAVEARSQAPMMPLRLFRSPAFSGTNLLTLFLYAALALITTFIPPNLQAFQGYSGQQVSYSLLPLALSLIVLSRFTGALVSRLGARLMLTVGPVVAGVGMFLLGVPGITAGWSVYWTTYFPGALLMGIGMGITVAPLTTTVMNSAPTDMSGTASGINNAVSRVAGVLGIALFTALALTVFAGGMEARMLESGVSAETRTLMAIEAAKLTNAQIPTSLSAAEQSFVGAALRDSFVETFRLIAWGSAGLAWLSALMAFLFVGRKA
jgi:EmrB/QacA subfamily drug resistance transporter